MNTYYLNVEEDGFGDWGDFPEYQKERAISIYTETATREIEKNFPGTEVVVEGSYKQNSEELHPDFEFIDNFLGNNWVDWLEEAMNEAQYGSVEFKGQKIVLTEVAYPTSRVMTEYSNELQFQGGGYSYMVEYKADGFAPGHKKVFVRWHFEVMREGYLKIGFAYTHDEEEENYDWDNVYDVTERWE